MNLTFCRRHISSGVGLLAFAMGLAGILAITGCGLAGPPPGSGGASGGGTSQGNPPSSVVLTASSTNVDFGNVIVGTSTAQLVTLTDTGVRSVRIYAISATGPGFSAGTGTTMTLTPGQAVTIPVNFDPSSLGTAQGDLSVSGSASNPLLQIGLSGAGIAKVVQHSVDLSWEASTSSVIGYFVYRGTTAGDLSKVNASVDQLTSYTDNTVAAGETYSYAVTSVDSNNVESAQSSPIFVTIPGP